MLDSQNPHSDIGISVNFSGSETRTLGFTEHKGALPTGTDSIICLNSTLKIAMSSQTFIQHASNYRSLRPEFRPMTCIGANKFGSTCCRNSYRTFHLGPRIQSSRSNPILARTANCSGSDERVARRQTHTDHPRRTQTSGKFT